MPNVPTAAITHRNPRLFLTNGFAKPCRLEPCRQQKAGFPQEQPAQNFPPKPKSDPKVLESRLAVLDFPIVIATHSPRIG